MPILRIKEIRDMSSEDRTGKLHEFRTELLRLKTMIGAGGTVENPARVKALRKAIAKILTVEHEEKRGIRKAEPKKEPKKKRSRRRRNRRRRNRRRRNRRRRNRRRRNPERGRRHEHNAGHNPLRIHRD